MAIFNMFYGASRADPPPPPVVPKRYGFRRTKAESDPSTRITYLYDAVGMTPVYMDFENEQFEWGNWQDFVESIARPVMLKTDGTVDYELDHDDQTKKMDGTASDVANTSYAGNAMVEFKEFKWVKRYEDAEYEYVIFSNTKLDSGYSAYAHTAEDGNVREAFYLGMYNSQTISSVAHSFGINNPAKVQIESQITYSKANGTGFNIMDYMKWNYVFDLLVLLGKSDNFADVYGYGQRNSNTAKANGTLKNEGAFYGSDLSGYSVKTLWLENIWGNGAEFVHGLCCGNSNRLEYLIKTHAPFCDKPKTDPDHSEYEWTGVMLPEKNAAIVTQAHCADKYGYLPTVADTSAAYGAYFCSKFSVNRASALTQVASVGDCANANSSTYGARYITFSAPGSSITNASRLAYT